MPCHIECEDEEYGRRRHAWCVCALQKTPAGVDNPVENFDCDPRPPECHRRRPPSSERPEKTPDSKRHEQDVQDQETLLAVRRDQACEKSGWWERLPESTDVLLESNARPELERARRTRPGVETCAANHSCEAVSRRELLAARVFRMNTHGIARPEDNRCAPRPTSSKPFAL